MQFIESAALQRRLFVTKQSIIFESLFKISMVLL